MTSFDEPLCLIVTGAGRGFGKGISMALVTKLKPGSVMILLGRCRESLQTTLSEASSLNSSVECLIYDEFECAALNSKGLTTFLDKCVSSCSLVKSLLLIHNAGTVGEPSRHSIDIDFHHASEYMLVNFSSMVATNSIVLSTFAALERTTIVNISSICAVEAGKSLAMYCSGKAARDMFFKVVAAEKPSIRVLNYAPGPLQTAMFDKIKNSSHDKDVKTVFQGMTPLKVEDSAERLIELLKADKFESGAHVDFFDPLPE